MAKLIISERQYKLIKEHISEEIDPSEAYKDEQAIQTIIDGKRDVGFLATYYDKAEELLAKAKEAGLKVISMSQDKHPWSTANVIYRKGSENKAMQLASIAKKNGGYLPNNNPEEIYVIGILLGYNPEKVKQFVLDKFPDFNFY